MPLFVWQSEYSVNVEELDIHHQKFIGIINTIYDNCTNVDGDDCVDQKIDELLALADYHFVLEEEYMKVIGFVDIDNHILMHRAFTNRIAALKLSNYVSNLDMSKELIVYLGNWLLSHVMKEDKRYAIGKNY